LHKHKAHALSGAVEKRTLSDPPLPPNPEVLTRDVRAALIFSSDRGLLQTPPAEVFRLLQSAREVNMAGTILSILGGATFDKPAIPDTEFFVRRDGTRFSFSITAWYPVGGPPVLAAYRFHLRFPIGRTPQYIRFDLNRGKGDPLSEPRSHVHAGAERLRVAIPIMTPTEALAKVLYGVPLP
jgi:hypothetical protein